jgi:hypothetical protein
MILNVITLAVPVILAEVVLERWKASVPAPTTEYTVNRASVVAVGRELYDQMTVSVANTTPADPVVNESVAAPLWAPDAKAPLAKVAVPPAITCVCAAGVNVAGVFTMSAQSWEWLGGITLAQLHTSVLQTLTLPLAVSSHISGRSAEVWEPSALPGGVGLAMNCCDQHVPDSSNIHRSLFTVDLSSDIDRCGIRGPRRTK